MVQLLIDSKADVSLVGDDEERLSPIHVAAAQRGGVVGVDIMKELLDARADVNAREWTGSSALDIRVQRDGLEVVQMLVTAGADVHGRGCENATPLIHAAKNRWPDACDIIRLLISQNADLNAVDERRRSPLSWAAFLGLPANVNLLLEANADVNVGSAIHAAADSTGTHIIHSLHTGSKPLIIKNKHSLTVEMVPYSMWILTSFILSTLALSPSLSTTSIL